MPNLLTKLNQDDRSTIRSLLRLYRQADRETQHFRKLSKVHCPSLCGYCCATANVQTSTLEMLPLAVELWSTNKADFWLKKLNRTPSKRKCVFFHQHKTDRFKGRCQAYSLRPLICRLFGFSFNKNKDGGFAYGGCKIIKKRYPKTMQNINKMLSRHPRLKKMSDFSIRLFGLGSPLDQKLIPINQALRIAIEKIGFILEKQKSACKM
jgi:Fe-S-cluster containining protein